MSTLRKLAGWLLRYVLATIVIITVTYSIVWIYCTIAKRNFSSILYWALLGEGIILISVGIASGLSTSEYAYIRKGAANPLTIRAGMEHFKRGPEKRGTGILLGVVGLTIILIWFTVYFH